MKKFNSIKNYISHFIFYFIDIFKLSFAFYYFFLDCCLSILSDNCYFLRKILIFSALATCKSNYRMQNRSINENGGDADSDEFF